MTRIAMGVWDVWSWEDRVPGVVIWRGDLAWLVWCALDSNELKSWFW